MHVARDRRRAYLGYRTRGINAVQHSPEQIREALAELPPCGPVEAVYFYGAGCGGTFPEATEKMVRELRAHFGTGRIEAETDLLGLPGRCSAAAKAWPASSARAPIRAGAGAAKSWKTSRRWGMSSATRAAGGAGTQPGERYFKGHIPLREEFSRRMG